MLPRQLQRPPTRTIAAAWRPRLSLTSLRRGPATGPAAASPAAAAAAFSSSRSLPRPAPWRLKRQDSASDDSNSLFRELFPEEAKRRANRIPPSSASRLDPTLRPSQQAKDEAAHDLTEPSKKQQNEEAQELVHALVLSAASKHLAESDFYRIGPTQTTHLEGWMRAGGISRVVADRDPATLAPTGRYFVQFDNDAAATAWRAELRRLWEQAKMHTPGVARKPRYELEIKAGPQGNQYTVLKPREGVTNGVKIGAWGLPVPSSSSSSIEGTTTGTGDEEADRLAAEVSGFTLVPPGMRWDLSPARTTARERALARPHGPLVTRLRAAAGSEFLVLVAVEGGRVSAATLRAAIREDGRARALAWRVRGLDHLFVPPTARAGSGSKNNSGKSTSTSTSSTSSGDSGGGGDSNSSGSTEGEGAKGARRARGKPARPPRGGIMPFGNSTLKAQDYEAVLADRDQEMPEISTTSTDTGGDGEGGGGEWGPQPLDGDDVDQHGPEDTGVDSATTMTRQQQRELADQTRRYPRFVVPFVDEAEARRFVRSWHRRQLTLQMGDEPGQGEDADADEELRSWQETRVLNVSYLW